MAWELSIGPNGWAEIKRAVTRLDVEDLAKALGDYNYTRFHGVYGHGVPADPHWQGAWSWRKLAKLPHDTLVDAVIDAIEYVRTTENGGNPVRIDPEGYHTVNMDDGILVCEDEEGCKERCTGDDSDEGWQYGPDMPTLCPEHQYKAYQQTLAHAG